MHKGGRLGGPVADLLGEHKSNKVALSGDCHVGMEVPCGQIYQIV